ncbi:WD40-repeat-containing domain protein, partial [Jimgerdemannia flammicorona]
MSTYPTRCVHTLSQEENSILSLAASDKYLFSGSQGLQIYVWDIKIFTLRGLLKGHQGSVLGLTLSPDQRLLFSSSGDGTVRVWDTETLECLYIIHPCSDVGDIFVVVYSAERETMYIGCQNTSIQWHNLSKPPTTPTTARFPPISPRYASSASSHFFDGYPADVSRAGTEDDDEEPARETRFVADGDVYMSAHDGYVYALLLGR